MVCFEGAGSVEVSAVGVRMPTASYVQSEQSARLFQMEKEIRHTAEAARSLQGARWPPGSLPMSLGHMFMLRTLLRSPPASLPWQHHLSSQGLPWLPAAPQGAVCTAFPPGVRDLTGGAGDLLTTAQAAAHVHMSLAALTPLSPAGSG